MATFNTRIMLKLDTFAQWTANNPVLLAGEVALVNIPADSSTGMNEPALMMKVGDGTKNFNSLPWASALAGDVIPSLKGSNPTLPATSITGLEEFIQGEIQDTDTQYQIVKNGNMGFKLQSKPKGGKEWTDVNEITLTAPTYSLLTGDTNGTVKFGVTGSETAVPVAGLKSAAYTESSAYDAAGAAAGVQSNLDDYETSNDAVIAAIKNGTTISSFGQVETALTENLQDAKDYTDSAIEGANLGQYATTAAMNSAISGAKTELIGTAGDASSLNTINAAKKYADEKIAAQIGSVYKPAGSVAFASLPTPAENLQGNVYNITDDFTADANFVTSEQGNDYPAGTNVVCIEESTDVWRWDVLAGSVSLDAYSTTEEMNQAISTSASSTLQSAKDYTDSAINGLDVAITNVATGSKVASIQQTDGKISVTTTAIVAGDIPELPTSKITGLDTTLSGINSDITALEGLVGETAVATQITNAINALDKGDSNTPNQFVTSVSQNNGLISVARAQPTIANISGLQDALDLKANIADLATVATTGKIDDLTQTATIIFNCGNSVV